MGDIEHLTPGPPALQKLGKVWLTPVEPYIKTCIATWDKPLAELTMPDVMAWALVFGYAIATGMLAGQLAGRIAVNVLRGPPRLR